MGRRPRWRYRLPGSRRHSGAGAQRLGLQAGFAWLAAGYIGLVHRTGRWQLRCDPATARLVRDRRPFIGAFWHGRMLMIATAWRALLRELAVAEPLQPCVVSSDHRDGRLMARATARFGILTVFGSTKRGRVSLLRAAQGVIERGQIPVFTPDGPRGPADARQARRGAARDPDRGADRADHLRGLEPAPARAAGTGSRWRCRSRAACWRSARRSRSTGTPIPRPPDACSRSG